MIDYRFTIDKLGMPYFYKPLIVHNAPKPTKIFKTFTHKDREITLCVKYDGKVRVGYSIKVPEDSYDKGLGQKIAEGRADKGRLLEEEVSKHFGESKRFLYFVAEDFEYKITNDLISIKGIR